MNIEELRKVAEPACAQLEVKRLDVFGSIARGDSTASSDVDLLVEFRDPDRHPARRFFDLLHYLEDALGCEVDLLTTGSLRNPYFKSQVLKQRIPVYEG
jgi:predicted nucleotidyltransferase